MKKFLVVAATAACALSSIVVMPGAANAVSSTSVEVLAAKGSSVVPPAPTGYPTCSVDVSSPAAGKMTISKMRCFTDPSAMLQSKGFARGSSLESLSSQQLAAASILSAHGSKYWLGPNQITINGTYCNGGGVTLSGYWNDQIESTRVAASPCRLIQYEHYNYTGQTFTAVPFGTYNITGYMANKTTALKYLAN
jgi:hypothetical protein